MTDEEFAKLKYLHKEAKKRGLKIVKNKKIAANLYYVADTMTNLVIFGNVNGATLEEIEEYFENLEEEYDDDQAADEEVPF